ncbi:MAG: 2-polyprenyl-3-methyl-6-methoxy-1,4-benzoquinone monooxygenase [Pseudomonadota bacterium]
MKLPTPSERLIAGFDNALRTLLAPAVQGNRDNPAKDVGETQLSATDKRHAAGLMRINQAGEVAAQGLYQGHALVARDASVMEELDHAAQDEADHLRWCTERLNELDARPSALNALWYSGAFAIGALSGLAGDRWSLGFIAETERQVVRHLDKHLQRLPETDKRSAKILSTMRDEEAGHGENAENQGAADLPAPASKLMQSAAKVMTGTAYWV